MTPTLDIVLEQVSPNNVPGWLRVALWGWAHANRHGHAATAPGQLRVELGFTSAPDVSRALKQARDRGLVDPCSTASCIVVPGRAIAPCEANHRGIP